MFINIQLIKQILLLFGKKSRNQKIYKYRAQNGTQKNVLGEISDRFKIIKALRPTFRMTQGLQYVKPTKWQS